MFPFLLSIISMMSLILADSNREYFNSLINHINNQSTGYKWTAKLHSTFNYDLPHHLKVKAGTFFDPSDTNFRNYTSSPDNQHNNNNLHRLLQTLPSSLDLRLKFPLCSSIWTIRDQGNCSSCWALAAMNTLSDRFCIQKSNSTSTVQREFSYEDIIECCPNSICGSKGNGCNGGSASGGFNYAQNVGVVTGAGFGNNKYCKSYFLSPTFQATPIVPFCTSTCSNNTVYKTPYSADNLKISSSKQIFDSNLNNTVLLTMNALNIRGTVQAFMLVYQDFFTYSSGVYHHVTGEYVGAHLIRIIGYGTLNGVDYWLCANTWGTSWGINGFFMIKRGVNESMIEGYLLDAYL